MCLCILCVYIYVWILDDIRSDLEESGLIVSMCGGRWRFLPTSNNRVNKNSSVLGYPTIWGYVGDREIVMGILMIIDVQKCRVEPIINWLPLYNDWQSLLTLFCNWSKLYAMNSGETWLLQRSQGPKSGLYSGNGGRQEVPNITLCLLCNQRLIQNRHHTSMHDSCTFQDCWWCQLGSSQVWFCLQEMYGEINMETSWNHQPQDFFHSIPTDWRSTWLSDTPRKPAAPSKTQDRRTASSWEIWRGARFVACLLANM